MIARRSLVGKYLPPAPIRSRLTDSWRSFVRDRPEQRSFVLTNDRLADG